MPQTKEISRDGLRLMFSEAVDCRWARLELRPGWGESVLTFIRFAAALEQQKFRRQAVVGIWPTIEFATPAQLAMVDVRAETTMAGVILVATAPGGYIGIVAPHTRTNFWLKDLEPSLERFDFGRAADRGRYPSRGPILLLHVFMVSEFATAQWTLDQIMDLVRIEASKQIDMPKVESVYERDLPPFYSGIAGMDDLSQLEFEHAIELEMEEDGTTLLESDRFLQAQSQVRVNGKYESAKQGFFAGGEARVRVHIGEQNPDSEALSGPFPVHLLPADQAYWDLAVWLTEPQHFAEQTLKRVIRLPKRGDSSVADFDFVVGDAPRFEGRITVLHQGRVLQTAVLRAKVTKPGMLVQRAAEPMLVDEIHVFTRLEGRRKFDLAIIQNHDSSGATTTTVLSDDRAWVADTKLCIDAAQAMNTLLSKVASFKSRYEHGLNSEDGVELLVELARQGGLLWSELMYGLDGPGNRQDIAANEFIQVVNTRTDSIMPFELIYDYELPQRGARLCPHWNEALQIGACPGNCGVVSRAHVCPMGFWGLRKVIERHTLVRELVDGNHTLFLQSEPTRDRPTLYLGGTMLIGGSKVVKNSMPALIAHLQARQVAVAEAKNWSEWEAIVGMHQPNLLVALPHTGGVATLSTMELGDTTVEIADIYRTHVCENNRTPGPIVALIGCDTVTTADGFTYQVMRFRNHGAAIVIGTIATVFGEHAVAVAQTLVTRLLSSDDDEPRCLGEIMRAVKRDGLRANQLMPLCLVAFGDADWKLSPKENADV